MLVAHGSCEVLLLTCSTLSPFVMPDVDSTYDQVYQVLALLVLPKSRRLAKLGIMA